MNSATKVRIEQRLGYVMGCGANIVKPEGMVFVLLVVFMVYPSILPFQANPSHSRQTLDPVSWLTAILESALDLQLGLFQWRAKLEPNFVDSLNPKP